MKKQLILLMASFLVGLGLNAQEKTSLEYMDVFELQYAGDPQISPQGDKIIYVRNQFDVMTDRKYTNLWMIDFTGENHRPITSGKAGYSQPTWSPDGKKLAYVSAEEGSAQIFVRWMETGQTASITNLIKGPGNITWSPDGQYIAFNMRISKEQESFGKFPSPPKGADWASPGKVIEDVSYKADGNFSFLEPSFNHIFIVSSEGGAPRQITSGDYDHAAPSWTADSKNIVFSANRSENAELEPNDTHIFKIDIQTQELKKLTKGKGPHKSPIVSPDGKSIVYLSFEDQFVGYQLDRVFVMDINGENSKELKHGLDRDFKNFTWSKDSKSLFAYYDNRGIGVLANLKLNGNAITITQDIGNGSFGRPYAGGSYSIAGNGRYAYTKANTQRPGELSVGHFPTKMANKTITNLNGTFLQNKNIGKVEEVNFKSKFDDKDVQGWIVYPPDFDKDKEYPLILEIHGGPHLAYGPHFSPELQLMAARGFVVLYTNPRGSTTYGEEFGGYINHNYPSEDYDDLMSGVDMMVEKGFIDEDRLYITGGSGGGVLTAWSIGKTDRFRAAVVSKPVINWYSFSLTADGYNYYPQYWFNKKPWEDPQQYLDRSPISLVGNVKTPTLLVTGEQDYRTPMSETEQYYGALKLQEVESKMVRIPGAGHGITARPSNIIRHVAYITGWFEKYD
jgi:dipeptidyl aminopeptidase/acylaminoacyl peptidase